ncbi:MAG: hypothetical protein GY861_03110 [bacterium]|nr:hypothetical protein [bacterium]
MIYDYLKPFYFYEEKADKKGVPYFRSYYFLWGIIKENKPELFGVRGASADTKEESAEYAWKEVKEKLSRNVLANGPFKYEGQEIKVIAVAPAMEIPKPYRGEIKKGF